jgi:protein-disulfide isomerase
MIFLEHRMKPILSAAAAALIAMTGCSDNGAGGNSQAAAKPVPAVPAPMNRSWTETVTKTDEGFRMGNPEASIRLVEYGARTCPTCGMFGRESAEPLRDRYVATGKVSYEFRDYLVHGAQDLAAALLGTCGDVATYFPILDQMYQGQEAYLTKLQAAAATPGFEAKLTNASPAQTMTILADAMGLVDFVKQRGIPEAKARACLTDKARMDALVKVTSDAQGSNKVTGTPPFFINDEPVPDTITWEKVEQELKRRGA